MSQCIARKTYTRERCRNEAAHGLRKCLLHQAMPPHAGELGRLKKAALRLGHIVISDRDFRHLMDDREQLKQLMQEQS